MCAERLSAYDEKIVNGIMSALRKDDAAALDEYLRSDSAGISFDPVMDVIPDVRAGGMTFLMNAACFDAVGCIASLVSAGADVNARDNDGDTATTYAVSNNCELATELLIRCGADVNNRNVAGVTPLMSAAAENSLECLKTLIHYGADVNAKTASGATPLTAAATHGSLSCIETLIQAGAEVNARDVDGETAIYYAASNNQIAAVEMLVCFGANVNERGFAGRTPLMYAAANQRREMVRYLLDHSAVVDMRDADGNTALSYAVRGSGKTDKEILRLLIMYGADPYDQYKKFCFFALPNDDPFSNVPFLIVPLSQVTSVIWNNSLSTVFVNPETCGPGTRIYNIAFS